MKQKLKCPNCDSEEVSVVKLSKLQSFFAIFVITTPFNLFQQKRKITYHCFDCYTDFDKPNDYKFL